ncbi:MAG: hypothetical protein H6570_18960 [Lewinellaceae bacterium]|nr:hypothetical protein [Lewinellaceae bacterium]
MFRTLALLLAAHSARHQSKHLSRKGYTNLPDEKCDNEPGFNNQVYHYMWGTTEFNVTGTLKDFDRSEDLNQISEPILFVTGEYDEARPETMYEFQKLSNNARVEIIEGAAHMTMIDQPQQLAKVISEFLNKVEN